MKYNVDYFLKLFKYKRKWADGSLANTYGEKCALGHMKFTEETLADKNEEAKSLAAMITHHLKVKHDVAFKNRYGTNPSSLIPNLNDSGGMWQRKDKNWLSNTQFGDTPKERVVNVLKEIKQECLKKQETKKTVDDFISFFEGKKKWKNGALGQGDEDAPHCALGHMRFRRERDANVNEEAKTLFEILKHGIFLQSGKHIKHWYEPDGLIALINDSLHVKSNDGESIKLVGTGPQQRILHLLNVVKKECMKNKAESQISE